MKKLNLLLILCLIGAVSFAQPFKVTTVQTYLDSYAMGEGSNNLEKAKEDADLTVQNEKTAEWAKAWFLRGKTYLFLASDKETAPKFTDQPLLATASESFQKALALNDPKFRDEDELFKLLGATASSFFNQGVDEFQGEKFANAFSSFSAIENIYGVFEGKGKEFPLKIEDVRNNAALCAQKAGMSGEAIKMYEAIVDKGTEDADVYRILGNLYLENKEPDKATALIAKGIEKFPKNIDLRIVELNQYLAQDKHEAAIDKLQQAIQLAPDNVELYVASGIAYNKMGKNDEAMRAYQKAIELDPKNLNAYNNLGGIYVDAANEYITQMNALGISKEDQVKYDQLNAQKIEEYKKALPYLQKAMELDPSNEGLQRVINKIESSLK